MSGFSLGGAVNSAADTFCGLPIVRTIVGNPLFVSLLILAIVATVAFVMYRVQLKVGGGKKALRASIYILLLITGVMFVHNYAIAERARAEKSSNDVRQVFAGIENNRAFGGTASAYPVWPPRREDPRRGRLDNVAVDNDAPLRGLEDGATLHDLDGSDLDIVDVVVPARRS